ncbi:E3 ubiquitin-protein ligase TRIM65 [Tiliqua scincoides]|uniref:E3 ubiquitin-protein ligase TRIM65 n=1 Tax=Tiliqua scincoides TaxID=71010 RepID=UPI0034620665
MEAPGFRKLEEKLNCCICLEVFTFPVTVPCGHSFCEQCINSHWNKTMQKGYSCPECRQVFPERPTLSKNVQLDSLVEFFRSTETSACGPEKTVAVQDRKCPRHGWPLELYCKAEKLCICCECSVKECKSHEKVLLEEERKKKEESLKEILKKTEQEAEKIMEEIQKLDQQTATIKDCSEKLKSGLMQKFAHLMEALKECQRKAVEKIEREQAAVLGQVQENWDQLQHQLTTRTQFNKEAEELLAGTDDMKFLEELLLLPSPASLAVPPGLAFDLASSVEPITSFFNEVARLQEAVSNSLDQQMADTKITPEPKLVVRRAGSCLPMNELRETFLKDNHNLTFDPATANHYLQLYDDNRKVIHHQGVCGVQPNDPQRFQPWQIMCVQNFNQGSIYWEVKLSGHSVIVGVAYRTISRKRRTGRTFTVGLDKCSWGLYIQEDCYLAWHNGNSLKIKEPVCKFIGVRLNYDQGILSFYGIDDNMKHIHSFHAVFTEALVPIFWLCEGLIVTLCQKPQSQVTMNGISTNFEAAAGSVEKIQNEQVALDQCRQQVC